MVWNFLYVQRFHRWSLQTNKFVHATLYWVCNYFTTLVFRLTHVHDVSEGDPWYLSCNPLITHHTYFIQISKSLLNNTLQPNDYVIGFLQITFECGFPTSGTSHNFINVMPSLINHHIPLADFIISNNWQHIGIMYEDTPLYTLVRYARGTNHMCVYIFVYSIFMMFYGVIIFMDDSLQQLSCFKQVVICNKIVPNIISTCCHKIQWSVVYCYGGIELDKNKQPWQFAMSYCSQTVYITLSKTFTDGIERHNENSVLKYASSVTDHVQY